MGAEGIITTVTDSSVTFLDKIGTGIVTLFQNLFTTPEGDMTVFAIVSLSMLGLGIATGLVAWIKNKF